VTILAAAEEVLARPPRPPSDPNLFASNTLFGQPGIYPDGTPMVPAAGDAPTTELARSHLASVLAAREVDRATTDETLRRFDDANLAGAVPDAGVRAALLLLRGTLAAALVDGFPERTDARSLRYGVPASPGRVVGPAATGDPADPADRVVNDRYQAEHPALVAPSLAHDLLWHPGLTGHAAETVLHAIVAMVHVQLVAAMPALAHTGTELARRQSSLAITLLNSRPPGSARVALCAPDGTGTIPGGAPGMQTIDFWSVPFAPVGDDDVPVLFERVLDALVPEATPRPVPLRFDERLGPWLTTAMDDRWLPIRDHVRASVALGLLDLQDIANLACVSLDDVAAAFGLGGGAASS
jgi:hypothetical protein